LTARRDRRWFQPDFKPIEEKLGTRADSVAAGQD
jgi:hypothetical protein